MSTVASPSPNTVGAWRWALVTAIAPISWGASYYVTKEFLPADSPFWGATLRALPAGIILLLVARALPKGSWWWKSAVLGVLNVGAFFLLIYLAAQLLPSSVAATIMALAPLDMMLVAWMLVSEKPRLIPLIGSVIGVVGVFVMLVTGSMTVSIGGVIASVAAMTMSAFGFVLSKRWSGEGVPVLHSTAWQLMFGGLALLVVAVAFEGAPPALDGPAIGGFAFLSIVATAIAYLGWFAGLKHLSAGQVGLIGLLNPVTGVLLGTLLASEVLTFQQFVGILLTLVGMLIGQPAIERLIRRGRDPRDNLPKQL